MIKHPTWLHPRIELRTSPIQGRGAFALGPIRRGEVVTVWAHTILHEEAVAGVMDGELYRRPDGRYVWLPESWASIPGYDPAEEFLNHSCNPNVWMDDEVTLSARSDITEGEELTADYALWEFDPDYVSPFVCRCGFDSCRGRITGRDWQLPELQLRYAGHFHPSIDARVRGEHGSTRSRRS